PFTCWTNPDVSPLTQNFWRERLQNVTRPLDTVRSTASRFIYPTIKTSPFSASCTTAGIRPLASNFKPCGTCTNNVSFLPIPPSPSLAALTTGRCAPASLRRGSKSAGVDVSLPLPVGRGPGGGGSIPHADASRGQIGFDLGDSVVAVVNHRGDEGGVGLACGDGLETVLRRACAPGGDDRNLHPFGNGAGQFQVVADLRPVPIHAGQQDLARAQRFRLL